MKTGCRRVNKNETALKGLRISYLRSAERRRVPSARRVSFPWIVAHAAAL